jgi:ABC-type phosphate/phosphonate transport system substrate-binding protein
MLMSSIPTRRNVVRALAAAAGLGLAVPRPIRAASPPGHPMVLGVFPYLPALQIGRRFGPVASAFAEICDRQVSLQTKSTFSAFRQLLLQGHYDLAVVHPFLCADAMAAQPYRPIGRLREDLSALIVAPIERRLAQFADLRGEIVATPPRLSAVYQLVEQELAHQGLAGPDGVALELFRTKTACMHAVASGTAAACALPGFALAQLKSFEPIAMEPKFATASIPGIALIGHGRLGERTLGRMRETVLGWEANPAGRRVLENLGWSGFKPVQAGEYDAARLRPRADT